MNNDMENYQLYRTNISLGGQLKWDLILDRFNDRMVIRDFHITPISNNVPCNKYIKDNLLNYTHQENVSRFYKSISGSFYRTYINPRLDNPHPLINTDIDPHDSQYEMGCSRSSYKLYNEQFEFLCPMWIEKLEDVLEFEISIYSNIEDDLPIISRKLKLDLTNNQSPECIYHDKFVNYFKNYIKYVGIDKGNEKLLAIHLKEGSTQISGLNAQNGLMEVKELPNLVNNLISRERPMLEFDNMIIQSLKDNTIVAPQLFNFNLCFNVDDLMSPFLSKMLIGKPIYIKVNTYIGDKLELRDFYSNYSFIPKKISNCDIEVSSSDIKLKKQDTSTYNVLSYLKDNQYIDFIDKNKLVQDTIHWSLVGNNNYIFNAYNGFGPVVDANTGVSLPHIYDNSPDLTQSKHTKSSNGLNWCTSIEFADRRYTEDSFSNLIENYTSLFTRFYDGSYWVNNIRYNVNSNKLDNLQGKKYDHLKVAVIWDKTRGLMHHLNKLKENNSTYVHIFGEENNPIKPYIYAPPYSNGALEDNYICFISDDENDLIFNNILKFINNQNFEIADEPRPDFLFFKDVINSVNTKDLSVITPSTTLRLEMAEGPSLSLKEIDYYKDDSKSGEYVLRYSGAIKPTFVSIENDINFNYIYKKDCIIDWKSSKYNTYHDSGYPPIYPSINYCSYIETKLYYDITKEKVKDGIKWIWSEDDIKKFTNSKYEYKWFNANQRYYLSPVLEFNEEFQRDESGKLKKIKDIIRDSVREYYNINEEGVLDYIFSLYDLEISFDYASPTDINNYIYKAKLTLK